MPHDKSPDESEMLRLAQAAKEEAYAPYSGYRVGVCLAAEDGALFASCNVENASYPEGSCAETGAIAALVASGGRRIRQVLVVADGERLCTPCGGCRQRLAEFAAPGTPVAIYGPEGLRARFTLEELLPHAFDLPNEATA
jgi:cytidine deaminase